MSTDRDMRGKAALRRRGRPSEVEKRDEETTSVNRAPPPQHPGSVRTTHEVLGGRKGADAGVQSFDTGTPRRRTNAGFDVLLTKAAVDFQNLGISQHADGGPTA